MSVLYPITFKPIFKEKIWGGENISKLLNKDCENLENVGESWELSGVKGDISVVANGELEGTSLRDLIATYKGGLVGDSIFHKYGTEFPLLIKFLDAQKDLSIQVHPNDEVALKKHGSFGKTEMWYIVDAEEDAELITGFNQTINREVFNQKLISGQLESVLNYEKADKGDVFFIPAGRIHTIGKGLLIAEIQQTSDVTYRVYDFDRVDKNGQKRELHTLDAIEALDFEKKDSYRTEYKESERAELVKCPYFTTNKLNISTRVTRNYSKLDSFVIYMNVGDTLELVVDKKTYSFETGQTFLIPALFDEVEIVGNNGQVLEVYIGDE